MSIEKLELVSVSGELSELNAAITACLRSGVFHMENAAKMLGVSEEMSAGRSGENPYAEPLKKLLELDLRQVKVNTQEDIPPDAYTPQTMERETERISEELRDVEEALKQARKQASDYENAVIHLKHLQSADVDLGELSQVKHISCRFGRMPQESLQKLEFYNLSELYFQSCHTEHDYVWGFCFTTPDRQLFADAILKGLLFESCELPKDLSGTPEQALAELQIRMTELKAECDRLEAEQKRIYETESENISRMYCFAKYQSEVYKLRGQCLVLHDKFNLMGYVPVSEKARFEECIDKIPELSVSYEAPYENADPPVRLKNGWFSRPFSMFVEMYGLPRYRGFNPTFLLAVSYTLLFGIMFGDLGQGILLALLGVFLDKKKHMPLGAIITRIGISGAIFGTLYGSVFGFENLLDPVYESLGISFLPLHAMENTNLFIYGAVALGAVIIIISMLVNIVVKLRQRDYEEGLFGNNGIAGLLFFLSLLVVVLGMVSGSKILPTPVLGVVITVTLLMMFFKEPLGAKLAHKSYEMPGMVDFIASNFFECFEYLLGYATNTLSFIRVGGFVFSHAGLMSVVMVLADMVGKGGSPLVIILGNLFVMGLEGLIVGIQVLRLEFYEIFSRCYEGDGKAFVPVSVTFDELTDVSPEPAH